MISADIRRTFLSFFEKNAHTVVPSSALVPHNDPTLMFTNSGMVQFKDVFTGQQTRPYTRATTVQKCIRAGGKHNDLDNVGYTARHHTFFEMLGNFSFGDYFKEEAIAFAWELMTQEFGLPKNRLIVTVNDQDDEAESLWQKISGISKDRIIRISGSDNFWSMGDTGPCGPCSEIFYDHGDHIEGGPPGSPNADGDRFVELWNLVFMQFEQHADGSRTRLPKPSIDTGMGLERIAAVLQGVSDNYDTDILRTLIEQSAHLSQTDPNGSHAVSHRVVADHLRASCFLIADGVLPSNEGRGYVLRRIMRRAMRHAHLMGCTRPLMDQLVPTLVEVMGGAYPELKRAQSLIETALFQEETRFKKTLDRGLNLLAQESAAVGVGAALPGDVAFKLYDTYGFPVDLTQDALRREGKTLDMAGFDAAMAQQKQAARAAWAGSGEEAISKIWFEVKDAVGASDFLGYATLVAEGSVVAIVKDGKMAQNLVAGEEGYVVLNQTPFYGESGGQAGDSGAGINASGVMFNITDTQKKLGDVIVHHGRLETGALQVGDALEMRVNAAERARLRAHHSATHLLQAALVHRLGDHVTQKGSLVTAEKLRFDFSHPAALSAEDIAWVERDVNRMIRENAPVTTRLMSPEEAMAEGAMALFGEKYGEEVRVVRMGGVLSEESWPLFSLELCGGTHVSRTGDIGFFKITTESSVAAGVRRIEAVAGEAAEEWAQNHDATLRQVARLLKSSVSDVLSRLEGILDDRKKATKGGSGPVAQTANRTEVLGVAVLHVAVVDVPQGQLRGMVDAQKKQIHSGIVVLTNVQDGKVSVIVGVTDDLTPRFDARTLLQAVLPPLGGQGGGGRADLAQGGGTEPTHIAAALQAMYNAMAS